MLLLATTLDCDGSDIFESEPIMFGLIGVLGTCIPACEHLLVWFLVMAGACDEKGGDESVYMLLLM